MSVLQPGSPAYHQAYRRNRDEEQRNFNNNALIAPPQLCVEKITEPQETVAKIVSIWQRVAGNKGKQATILSEKSQFIDCLTVSSLILGTLQPLSAYICKDENANSQGMMMLQLKTDHVYIQYLVTNPINIRSSVNNGETKKVRGVGTCLLNKAEEIAVQEGKGSIQLHSFASAVPFYRKGGFSCVDGDVGASDDEVPMKKRVQKTSETASVS